MIVARQSTARTVMIGPVLDSSGVAVTDCVVADFEGSVNGGDPAALNGSATLTHRGVGFYSLALTATDLATVGSFEVSINDTTNACAIKEITVIEESVYDALFAASALGYVANAPVNVAQFGGSNGTFSSGRPEVNATHWGGTAVASANVLIDNGITAAKIAADAVAEIQSGLATSAEVTGLNVNTRANIVVPVEIETPDASTQVYKIRLFLFDVQGNMEAPDSTPTIALVNAAGTDRSSRLSSASNPSTGVYSWDYTATAGDAEEQLNWTFTVVEGGLTRTYPAVSYVVEETAYRFSSSDRANLNAVLADTNELQTDWADGGRLDLLLDAILADTGTDGVVISAATANAIADALLDRAAGVETNRTPRQALRLILAALVGKLSGAATTTVTIRDTNDGVNRVVATVDSDGNRSAVTLDAS